MTTTKIVESPLGRISITFNSEFTPGLSKIYINEFLGTAAPPQKLQDVVDGFITLPGYEGMPIKQDTPGKNLCWQVYGKAVAALLKNVVSKPVGLLGNSMGAMIAIYAALEPDSIVDHLVLYRVPTFGELRGEIHSKYGGIANSIVNDDVFNDFLTRIDSRENATFIRTLKAAGWQSAKKLYAGAANSDLNPSVLKNIRVPVYFLIDPEEVDEVHPETAKDKMFSLMTGKNAKEFIQLKDLKDKSVVRPNEVAL